MTDRSLPPWWSTVDTHARQAGVNPDLIARIGGVESGFRNIDTQVADADGRPASSATGPFQFIKGTWDDLARRRPDLTLAGGRRDPEAQARAIPYFTAENISILEDALGREPTGAEVYLAHFLGVGDAPKVITATDDTPVSEIVSPASYRANLSVMEGKTAADLRAWAASKIGDVPARIRADPGASPAQPDLSGPLTPASTSPVTPLTLGETRDLDRVAEEDRPGLLDAAGMAFRQESMLTWFMGGDDRFVPDPAFQMTPDLMKDLGQDVPTRYLDYFARAHSLEHAHWLRDQMIQDLAVERQLASLGWTGVGLRLGATVLDPAAILVGLGTGGTASWAVGSMKAGRLGTIVANALGAAAGNVAIDSAIIANKPVSDTTQLLYSAAGGLAIGAAFGALARNRALTDEVEHLEALGTSLQRDIVRREVEARRGTVGAAQASHHEPLRVDTQDYLRDGLDAVGGDKTFGAGAGPALRWDVAGQLRGSDNVLTRILGAHMVEDAVGSADRARVTPFSASEMQHMLQRRMDVQWKAVMEPAYAAFAKERGLGWVDRMRNRKAFNEEITAYVRNQDPTRAFDPHVAKAGNAWRTLMNRYRHLANNPGLMDGTVRRPVRGFGIQENPNYVPRIHDHRKVNELLETFGDANICRLIAAAIRGANNDIEQAVADQIARAYLRRVREVELGNEVRASRFFSGEDLEEFRRVLSETTELDGQTIDDLASMFQPRRGDGASSRGKRRQLLDETFGMTLRSDRTGEVRHVHISDMLNNDVDDLFMAYNRSMSGQIALANIRVRNPNWTDGDSAPAWLVDGITARGEWETFLKRVEDVGRQSGQSSAAIKRDLETLEFVYEAVAGIPRAVDRTEFAQVARMLRDYNFVRVMGQVGFAQIAEMGNIVGQAGWKAALHGMPALRAFMTKMRGGQDYLKDDLLVELEVLATPGTDWLRGATMTRWDDFGNPMVFDGENRTLNTVETALHKGKRAVSMVSGMTPINAYLQRWTVKAVAVKFADMARKPTRANLNRMRTLGLDDAMLARITDQVKAHATFVKGEISGRTLRRMNLETWDDMQAAATFEQALFRWTRRIIQENDVGAMAKWMSHPVAKIITQFRTFMLGAWTKQFLHNVHMRDWETFAAFSWTTVVGGMVYAAQMHIQAASRSDREAFLEERLGGVKPALAAWQRSSWATLFPMLIDNGLHLTDMDPLFDVRASGQPSSLLFGNPTAGLLDDIHNASSGLVGGLSEPPDQRDMRAFQRVLPFQNTIPFMSIYNALISPLPSDRQ